MRNWVHRFSKAIGLDAYADIAQWIINQAVEIQQIAAPTFDERRRAEYVRDQFAALGLQDIAMDHAHNVYGRMCGANPTAPALMLSAHTDTVFGHEIDLTLRHENGVIYGPGLGDNSIGVAGMLGLAYALRQHNITPECDLWFVATTGEEGLGDLIGMRAAYDRLKDHISGVINIEGLAFGHIYHAGIAVKRLKITAHTEGGHSWLHFGRASAVHALIQLGARITNTHLPTTPRTTYNIGMIEGGISVNTIAPEANMLLDMRSEDQAALNHLEEQVRAHIRGLTTRDQAFEVDVVGNRPAGSIAVSHPLVQGALAALEIVGQRGTLETGSTDGNIPLAAGCAAVTVGITRGGNAHRTDEFVEIAPVQSGIQQLITLALATAAYQAHDLTVKG